MVSQNHASDHPVRPLNEWTTVEHKMKSIISVKFVYQLIDEAMKAAGINTPVVFNRNFIVSRTLKIICRGTDFKATSVCLSLWTSLSILQVEAFLRPIA